MKKISEKSRKILRKIYMVLGAAAISVLFAACYGMPIDDYEDEDCAYPCCVDDSASQDEAAAA